MDYEQWLNRQKSLTLKDLFNFYHEPDRFVLELFPWGFGELKNQFPREWQLEYLQDLKEEIIKRGFTGGDAVPTIMMSTASGHEVGKSCLSAWLILFLHFTRKNSKGMVTAVTRSQIRGVTWAETLKWYNMNPVFNKFSEFSSAANNLRLSNRENPTGWTVRALTVEPHNAEAFQGQHAHGSTPFVIMDEASGIDDTIFETAKYGTRSGEPHLHIFGNMTQPSGFFQRSHYSEKDLWIARNVCRTKVFPGNEQDKIEIEKYGWDSDRIRVRIRGLPPKLAATQFIGWDDIDLCIELDLKYHDFDPLIFGVDMGSVGVDKTVIVPLKGMVVEPPGHPIEIMDTNDIPTMEDRIAERIEREKPDHVWIDSTGHGAGSVQHLRRRGFLQVQGVNFARKAEGTNYANKRSYMYGQLQQKIQQGQLQLPRRADLREELGALTYSERPDGKIQLDLKKEIKKRLGRSPDIADALALTQAMVVGRRRPEMFRKRKRGIVRI